MVGLGSGQVKVELHACMRTYVRFGLRGLLARTRGGRCCRRPDVFSVSCVLLPSLLCCGDGRRFMTTVLYLYQASFCRLSAGTDSE